MNSIGLNPSDREISVSSCGDGYRSNGYHSNC